MENANRDREFACNVLALSTVERLRHRELLQRLRPTAHEISELAYRYRFHLNSGRISVLEAPEWVKLERRSCPCAAFELQIAGRQNALLPGVKGPAGVKLSIDAELR